MSAVWSGSSVSFRIMPLSCYTIDKGSRICNSHSSESIIGLITTYENVLGLILRDSIKMDI